MRLRDLARFTLAALTGHRLRSLLSLLGVAIGVTAVVVLTALGEGARRFVIAEFASIGTNLLITLPGRTETSGAMPGVIGVPNDLTLSDAEAVRRLLPGALAIAPVMLGTETVAAGEKRRQVAVIGTTADYLRALDLPLGRGSFLPGIEADRGAPVTVLGNHVARELFGAGNPVGEVVRVGEWRLRVIGVMAPIGTKIAIDFDEVVFVPVATAGQIFNRSALFRILVSVNAYSELEATRERVRDLLVERHGEEDFTLFTEEALVSTFDAIFNVLTLALGAIAAISLTVAGIGIMNVMLVAVSERTKEVGLLRALGVERRQIAAVFLAEAVVLSAAGGALGLTGGFLLVRLLTQVYPTFPASPPGWALAAAVSVAVTVGGFFGFLPAQRAARLDPVAALARR